MEKVAWKDICRRKYTENKVTKGPATEEKKQGDSWRKESVTEEVESFEVKNKGDSHAHSTHVVKMFSDIN